MVYYFVRDYDVDRHLDADNLSKKIWDALEGVLYEDDKAIRLRTAGIIETGDTPSGLSLNDIDCDRMKDETYEALLSHINNREEHMLYVKIGLLKSDCFVF